ncbi:MAG: hypothetical protein K2N21_03645 [Rikenellaceae bacterium]|nr:hypothetical protein [Rikenellaceae bacterium]
MILMEWLKSNYEFDNEARAALSDFVLEDGSLLKPEKVIEYATNASVINAIVKLMNSTSELRKSKGDRRLQWEDMAEVVALYKQEYHHTLPTSTLRLRRKVADYMKRGVVSLISGKVANQNARKVNHKIERLLLSLDSLPTRPFNTTVAQMYRQFLCGEIEVYDLQTGELLAPSDYFDKNGDPIDLSDRIISRHLTTVGNKTLRAKGHDTQYDFNNRYAPHHFRRSPTMSFSKISLDDRDLPRKIHGGSRVKAYYAYDVASGCVIGYAHRRDKDTRLFVDCLRSMFRTIEQNGWMCPAEIEVENHLTNQFADTLLQAGAVFPFVRWCNPANSQEKRAEHFNRSKKYQIEKLSQVGIGRWYSKLEANRPRVEKVYDEKNNTYKEKTYSYDELVADDIRAIYEYNHMMHPNQAMYPGMTRWDVLTECQNPNLQPLNKALLYRYIGDSIKTTIRRNMYCSVAGDKFMLPSPEVLERLQDEQVTAYYIANGDGKITEAYIYQDDRFITKVEPVVRYNESRAEQTQEDIEAFEAQVKYAARFRSIIKRNKIRKVGIMPNIDPDPEIEVVSPTIQEITTPATDVIDYRQLAQQNL